MTELIDRARSACGHWQRVLRLQDWNIRLEFARLHELDMGTLGDCAPHRDKRQARIRLLDPRDVDGQGFWFDGETWNWELTLVHELLHLHFHDIVGNWSEASSDAKKAVERAIDAMAKALLAPHTTGADL